MNKISTTNSQAIEKCKFNIDILLSKKKSLLEKLGQDFFKSAELNSLNASIRLERQKIESITISAKVA